MKEWMNASHVRTLFAAFARSGEELRFVGGCVRDGLLGRSVRDLDAATPAHPEKVMQLLQAAGLRAIPTGLAHGTVTALVDNVPIEITTLRRDAACDGRHAKVEYTNEWREDAARRDFTMNALYVSADGELTDYFGGADDAGAGRVRFIGDAGERIREDYLRILRFFRFFAHYGKGEPDAAALIACNEKRGGLRQLSGERIAHEMLRLLAAPKASPVIALMKDLLGEIELGDVDPQALARLEAIEPAPDALTRLGVLLLSAKIAPAKIQERWKLSGVQTKILEQMAGDLMHPKADLRGLGKDIFIRRALALAALKKIDAAPLLKLAEEWTPPHFPLTGADLIEAGFKQGVELGTVLGKLERQWEAEDYKPTREELLKWAAKL